MRALLPLLLLLILAACGRGEAPGLDAGGDAAGTRACNGHPSLCERRLDEVVFPATHNAMSNKAEGWSFPNQHFGLTRQLEDGVRGFLIDTKVWQDPTDPDGNQLWLCHGSCLLGKIPLVDALKEFDTFLDAHPNEVLIFVVQDAVPPADFAAAMADSGLLDHVLTHTPGEPFPTLGALIDAGTRVLVTAEGKGGPPSWLLRFAQVGFDTPYSFKTMDALRKAGGDDDSCRKFRGTEGAPVFLMNHWVAQVLPTPVWSEQANAKGPLLARAQRCAEKHGRKPTLIAVDHYDVGALFEVVRELNGITP